MPNGDEHRSTTIEEEIRAARRQKSQYWELVAENEKLRKRIIELENAIRTIGEVRMENAPTEI